MAKFKRLLVLRKQLNLSGSNLEFGLDPWPIVCMRGKRELVSPFKGIFKN